MTDRLLYGQNTQRTIESRPVLTLKAFTEQSMSRISSSAINKVCNLTRNNQSKEQYQANNRGSIPRNSLCFMGTCAWCRPGHVAYVVQRRTAAQFLGSRAMHIVDLRLYSDKCSCAVTTIYYVYNAQKFAV